MQHSELPKSIFENDIGMFCVLFLMFTIKYLKISNEFYLDNLVYCNIDYINIKNKDRKIKLRKRRIKSNGKTTTTK